MTAKELVTNKALSGTELARILIADFTTLLERHGLLSGQMAFARVAYDLRLTLHLDLPSLPSATDHLRSRPVADDAVARNPALAAIESAPPLASPSPSAIFTSDNLRRDIDSPNALRLEHGLPVDVETRDNDGHVQERAVRYPADYPGLEHRKPVITDVTDEDRAARGLPPDSEVAADARAPEV